MRSDSERALRLVMVFCVLPLLAYIERIFLQRGERNHTDDTYINVNNALAAEQRAQQDGLRRCFISANLQHLNTLHASLDAVIFLTNTFRKSALVAFKFKSSACNDTWLHRKCISFVYSFCANI